MAELRLFGARPSNGVESVRAELEASLEDEDALVIHHGHIATFREVLVTMLQVPVVSIGINLFALFLQLPFMLLRDRGFARIDPSEYEAMAGDRPTHFVEEHPLEHLASVGWPVILANWLFLLGSTVFWRSLLLLVGLGLLVSVVISLHRRQGYPRLAIGLFCVVLGAAVWLLVAGYLNPFLLVVYAIPAAVTVGWTNKHLMNSVLEEAATVAADREYDKVCLVTNGATVTALLERVGDTDLTVVDAFVQRRTGTGYHLDADGEPIDQPVLKQAGDHLESRITAQFIDWAVVAVLLAGWAGIELVGMALVNVALGLNLDFAATAFVIGGVWVEYGTLWLFSLVVPPTAYYTLTEGLWGQTVGKRVRDIRVVHTDGSAPGLRMAFGRTLVGWFDAMPIVYLFGAVRIAADDYGRRFGDLAAGTVVVETEVTRTDATAPESADSGRAPDTPDEDPTGAAEPGADVAEDGESQSLASTADHSAGETQVAPSPTDETTVEDGTADDASTDESNTTGITADEEWTAAALDDEE